MKPNFVPSLSEIYPDRPPLAPLPDFRHDAPRMAATQRNKTAVTMAKRVTARTRRTGVATPLPFDRRLVLQQWMLSLLEVRQFEQLAEDLRSPSLEGFDENNVSRYFHALSARLWEREQLTRDVLLSYDENIVRHWQRITERRSRQGHTLTLKYFQYLALLFTEIYLDRYFRDPAGLLAELNQFVAAFNEGKPARDQVEPFAPDQLNKLAFWNATGSGKTLLMHVNILEYQHYLEQHGRQRDMNRIILLTPNEGLSLQHLYEFELSDIEADLFRKEGRSLYVGRSVEVIDIHKLKEEMGEKTVAIDAFEGKNLVLVDEGHRGAAGIDWMSKRNQLCEQGFSFEYSATFGQAMKAANKPALIQQYAKCILFDYSYKYFYRDGYGKDYQILNLEDDSQEDIRRLYLTACVLVFYQQLRRFRDNQQEFRPFLIEHPLWIFVGGSVNAVRTQRGRQVSDVLDILLVLADFVHNRGETVSRIDRLLKVRSGLQDAAGREIFANAFTYLVERSMSAGEVFDDVLRTVFNAPAQAMLHVENLKGTDGEIALRLGDNEPFGLINVGDAPRLCSLCEEQEELAVAERDFAGSLFQGLNAPDTTINLLIGSKKFTEGWNSWRVSTMGLMNIGRSEGSEIIQLFGRGVRLYGYQCSLKRSSRDREEQPVRPPKHLRTLETLHIFGIRAD